MFIRKILEWIVRAVLAGGSAVVLPFRNKKKELPTPPQERRWFEYTGGSGEKINGIVLSGNWLELRLSFRNDTISIKVSPESADKITKWMLKQYPQLGGELSNVMGSKKLAKVVPLRRGKTNPGPGPRPPRK